MAFLDTFGLANDVPVKYRCTNADFPEDRDPTIPRRISGTPLDNVHSWLLTKESEKKIKKKLKTMQ
jgi:hypothetical protein